MDTQGALDSIITILRATLAAAPDWLPQALNSNFVTSFIGAGAGAWAGAYAAQRIAERSKRRDDLILQIRNANAAVRLAGMICNSCIMLKKQQILPMKRDFDATKAELIATLRLHSVNAPPTVFRFSANFRTIPPISIPSETLETLQKIVFEKIDGGSKPTIMVPTLLQAISHFNSAVIERNKLIDGQRASPLKERQLAAFYFGLPNESGDIDDRYSNLMEALMSYIDDCLFFSKSVANALEAHGTSLRDELRREYRGKTTRVVTFKITDEHASLIPESSEYPGWEKVI